MFSGVFQILQRDTVTWLTFSRGSQAAAFCRGKLRAASSPTRTQGTHPAVPQEDFSSAPALGRSARCSLQPEAVVFDLAGSLKSLITDCWRRRSLRSPGATEPPPPSAAAQPGRGADRTGGEQRPALLLPPERGSPARTRFSARQYRQPPRDDTAAQIAEVSPAVLFGGEEIPLL